MAMTDTQKKQAVFMVLESFLEAVRAGGSIGAPAGVMYAAVCDKIPLSKFYQLMAALERNGNVRRDGDLYFFVKGLGQ